MLNVTLNDSGLYTCNVSREFEFEAHRPFVKTTRLIPLRVTEEGKTGAQSLFRGWGGGRWLSTHVILRTAFLAGLTSYNLPHQKRWLWLPSEQTG